jgi:hypothetical protein
MSMEIEGYSFGSMTIEGRRYESDLKIFPDRVVPHWWRKEGHVLSLEDIEDVLESKPEILIVGTGYSGMLAVSDALRKYISGQGILLIIEKTSEAWKTFNRLSPHQKVVAAFHVTC